MSDEKRIVLIKPGDVLMIGGVTFSSADEAEEVLGSIRNLLGSPVMAFGDDIQIDALTRDQVRDLAERSEATWEESTHE